MRRNKGSLKGSAVQRANIRAIAGSVLARRQYAERIAPEHQVSTTLVNGRGLTAVKRLDDATRSLIDAALAERGKA